MLHPQYWSLKSIYDTFKHGRGVTSDYLGFDVKGKVVLDVGAADGDTAKWFLKQGAKHVICVEVDRSQAAKIKGKRHLKEVTVYNEHFKLRHLAIPHDCMKFDIEGYEQLLLDSDDIHGWMETPTIMEVHNWYLIEQFSLKGFHTIKWIDKKMLGMAIMANYP